MKSIIATHKEGIRYIEHCRINVTNGRLTFIKKEDAIEKHFSVPYFNISTILLGEGTSLTQKAAKFLSNEGVMVGFVATGSTPLFLASQNEYRATEYCQKWIEIFLDVHKKLEIAKYFQKIRVDNINYYWNKLFNNKYKKELQKITESYIISISNLDKESEILLAEARFSSSLYRILKKEYDIDFSRKHKSHDDFNSNLDQGNYLAYGLASTTLWNLGIPSSLPVLHGKTRRGGLVFDLADVIKDAFVMPIAFKNASEQSSGMFFRENLIDVFDQEKVLKNLFKTMKEVLK